MDENIIKNEIRTIFNLINPKNNTYYQLKSLNDEYEGYVVTDNGWKGVAFRIGNEYKDFKYSFENVVVKTIERKINNEYVYLLELVTCDRFENYIFSTICMSFIYPGEDGDNRKRILYNPQDWVDQWISFIGNKKSDENLSSRLGELLVLEHLLKEQNDVSLTFYGTHDIESKSADYEVKTTTQRYGSFIEVNSQYQFYSKNGVPLYLYFVRLELSKIGISIIDVVNNIKSLGFDTYKIEKEIHEYNTESINRKYKINEMREYLVNDEFPKIVEESFVEGRLPLGVSSIKYTVDLEGLNYNKII